MAQLSIFSSAEPPASPSASPDSELDWLTAVVTSPYSIAEFYARSVPAGLYGRTSPASLVLTQMKQTVEVWQERDADTGELLQKRQILQPSSWDFKTAGIASRGACLTANTSEFPRSVVESSLSDILEMTGDHLQRYCLSPTACAGILRRAKKRDKTLPPRLRQVLEEVAARGATRASSSK